MLVTSKHIPSLQDLSVEIFINWDESEIEILKVWKPMPLRDDCDEVNVTDLYSGKNGHELSDLVQRWFDSNYSQIREDYLAAKGEYDFDSAREMGIA